MSAAKHYLFTPSSQTCSFHTRLLLLLVSLVAGAADSRALGLHETTISGCLDKQSYLIRVHIKVNQSWGTVIGQLDNTADHGETVVYVISYPSAGWG